MSCRYAHLPGLASLSSWLALSSQELVTTSWSFRSYRTSSGQNCWDCRANGLFASIRFLLVPVIPTEIRDQPGISAFRKHANPPMLAAAYESASASKTTEFKGWWICLGESLRITVACSLGCGLFPACCRTPEASTKRSEMARANGERRA